MKKTLTITEILSISSMLFGMFFGAGNLIFPAFMGQSAGYNFIPATIGFLISGVGLPLLAVAALAMTYSNGLQELSSKVGRRFGYLFTCALYLTIGPLFAIPRCFTVPFETGIAPILFNGISQKKALFFFTLIFFALMLYFSLHPGKIIIWVGKLLNPLFLLVFGWIIVTALLNPMGNSAAVEPQDEYLNMPFVQGILEGYNTMDALAGLAFGIIVVNAISSLGISEPEDIAKYAVKTGILACMLMGFIYTVTVIVGAQSRNVYPLANNGGAVLSAIALHYYPGKGAYLFAIMIFLACLKTAVGLITSCSETFNKMFPTILSYRKWAILFSITSMLIANIGLSGIIQLSIPVLMMLYPLAVTLILLSLTEKTFSGRRQVYQFVIGITVICACFDFCAALPTGMQQVLHLDGFVNAVKYTLPLASIGLGWAIPTLTAYLLALFSQRVFRKQI